VIVVRVEIWPFGDPRPLRQIALLGIVNVGPSGDGRHTYEAHFEGRITRVSHKRADGALVLVARAIDALAEGSEPDPLVPASAEVEAAIAEPSTVSSADPAGGHCSRRDSA
jgi:hypothetical protein